MLDGISKLMKKRHLAAEMKEIADVKEYTKTIPQHDKYFLLSGITTCDPGELDSTTDLARYQAVCTNLVKKGFTVDTVNARLNELGIINIPYGGIDLNDYWHDYVFAEKTLEKRASNFVVANNALIRLLQHGIVPLNATGYYHNDIKDSNVLFSLTDKYARLIDWGLSFSAPNPVTFVPKRLLEFNSLIGNWPFGCILFGSMSQLLPTKTPEENAYSIFKPLKTTGGHYASIARTLLQVGLRAETAIPAHFSAIIRKFYDAPTNTFRALDYFSQVFAHNVDIWGFLMIYADYIKSGKQHYMSDGFQAKLKILLKTYCFDATYAVARIPLIPIIKTLHELNALAGSSSLVPSESDSSGESTSFLSSNGPSV